MKVKFQGITTEKEALQAVKQNGYALQYVDNKTELICLEAVKQDGDALQYVDNKTELICLDRQLSRLATALRYVTDYELFTKLSQV